MFCLIRQTRLLRRDTLAVGAGLTLLFATAADAGSGFVEKSSSDRPVAIEPSLVLVGSETDEGSPLAKAGRAAPRAEQGLDVSKLLDLGSTAQIEPFSGLPAGPGQKSSGEKPLFMPVGDVVAAGDILPEELLVRGDGTKIDPDTPVTIESARRIGKGGGWTPKACTADYYLIKVVLNPSTSTFQVGPYGTGGGAFGSSDCAQPSQDPISTNFGCLITTARRSSTQRCNRP